MSTVKNRITIFDVARYILYRLGDTTTMKLQKLAYYCQAWSLAWDAVPLFDEDFQACANGPVCPELFESHRGVFELSRDYFGPCDPGIFTKEQIETMDTVIDGYGDKPSSWLSELTHLERPWKQTRGDDVRPGEKCTRIIPKDLMQEYYEGLRDA